MTTQNTIDEMIAQMEVINKAIVALKNENKDLKKEIVRLQWMLKQSE